MINYIIILAYAGGCELNKSEKMTSQPKRKEIYKYNAPWTVYGMSWSVRPDKRFRLALGSFIEEYSNKVRFIY